MPNKKMLPRELKLKEKVASQAEEILSLKEEQEELKHILDNAETELKHLRSYINSLKDEISDLADFKKITRLALPHIEAKSEVQAIANYSNDFLKKKD